MTSLGKILKERREVRYLTIEEVSQTTKIKTKYIIALEEEDLTILPPRVYTLGFIRNLSALYQIPAEDVISAYDHLYNLYEDNLPKEKSSIFQRPFISHNDNQDVVKVEKENDTVNEWDYKKEFMDNEFRKIKENIEKEALDQVSRDYPSSKVVSDFEALIREEELFETQKIRKATLERNMNNTRSIKKNDILNMYEKNKKGPKLMILILLGIVILLLLYVIIMAIVGK